MPFVNQNFNPTSQAFRYFFTDEILNMMHAFGDHSRPMPESAQLIESIVHEQLTALLDKANKIANIRSSSVIGAEDILFLMRKDKSKLVRLINHLYVKDIKSSISAQMNAQTVVQHQQQHPMQPPSTPNQSPAPVIVESYSNRTIINPSHPAMNDYSSQSTKYVTANGKPYVTPNINDPPNAGGAPNKDFYNDVRAQQNRRVRICYDYMSQLDEFGEYKKVFNQALFDEIKNQRLRRIDLMTRNMTQAEYLRFTKARQISFMSKVKPAKFSDWLLSNSPRIKVNLFAFEIIQYLAHETVAQIIDMSLLVKQDEEREPGDPISALITKSFYNTRDRIILNSTNYKAHPFAGGVSVKPTSVSVMYSQSAAQQNTNLIGNNIQCVMTPNLCVTPDESNLNGGASQGYMYASDLENGVKRRKLDTTNSYLNDSQAYCIRPSHIHEAIRRYCTFVGPFSSHQPKNRNSALQLLCI